MEHPFGISMAKRVALVGALEFPTILIPATGGPAVTALR